MHHTGVIDQATDDSARTRSAERVAERRSREGRPEGGQPPPGRSERRSAADRRRRRRRRIRIRRAVALVVVAGMLFGVVSAVGAVTEPGNAALSVRWVEWVRGHGGARVVAIAERVWYEHHQPPVGGRPAPGLIKAHSDVKVPVSAPGVAHLPAPPSIAPIVTPALAGEGQWRPAGPLVDGVPAIYVADLRPDPVHTSLVAAVAWMDPTLLSFRLFAGAQEPPTGGPWKYMAPIASSLRPTLAAAFNSGFRMQDAQGGYYAEGKTAVPLVKGAASLVIFRNGQATVGQWGRDVSMGSDISSVRQNLSLIVDGGHPVAGLRRAPTVQCGATVGGHLLVWRSGIGVTSNGALVYAAGPGLSAYSLADVLAHAGAVRAMELDINTDWVNYFYFDHAVGQPASPSNGQRLLPTMLRPPLRYFEGTARDFVGVFARPRPVGHLTSTPAG